MLRGCVMLHAADSTADTAASLRACAYPRMWRLVAATLTALSRANLPVILLMVLFATDPPITPPILVRVCTLLVVLPGLAAWLIARAFAVDVEVRDGEVVVHRRDLRLEIPVTAIERVVPWTVPLPGPGCSLRMRSGRRLPYGLQLADPLPLLSALAGVGALEAARPATRHATVVYAHAKQRGGPWRWYHWVAKFVVFALVPTVPLFNVHQYIAYGGTLGEYYLLGFTAYVRTFAIYWGTLTIYLVLYASVLRGVAEGVALVVAWVAPARVAGVRRAAEIGCNVFYYGGVPVLLALRFLQ